MHPVHPAPTAARTRRGRSGCQLHVLGLGRRRPPRVHPCLIALAPARDIDRFGRRSCCMPARALLQVFGKLLKVGQNRGGDELDVVEIKHVDGLEIEARDPGLLSVIVDLLGYFVG